MQYESSGFVCGVGAYVPRVAINTNISLVSRQIIQISRNILPFSLLNTIFRNRMCTELTLRFKRNVTPHTRGGNFNLTLLLYQ